ncbi:MAG: hypothetical protein JKX84_07545 [Flavobacteriales bacterium]|nr:hypothetical protein [Flavobacteriales bacterium]
MRLFFIFIVSFLFGIRAAQAVDFTKISRTEPVTTVYHADFKCYVDVSLFINTKDTHSGNIFLRVSYIIGDDTLNDNVLVDENYNGVLKQLFLDEGERLTAIIHLNNADTESLQGIVGSFGIVRNPEFKPSSDQGKNTFVGNVWKSDQTPLFRVKMTDSIPQVFRLTFTLNENYEFDKLYFKMKVISPASGILMLDKEVVVNEGSEIDLSRKTFSLDFEEIDLSHSGSYYFQVMQNMAGLRVNGIEKVEYEIVLQ